jgi:hypothetical protein
VGLMDPALLAQSLSRWLGRFFNMKVLLRYAFCLPLSSSGLSPVSVYNPVNKMPQPRLNHSDSPHATILL